MRARVAEMARLIGEYGSKSGAALLVMIESGARRIPTSGLSVT